MRLVGACLLLLAALAPAGEQEARIRELIAGVSHPDPAVRQAAQRELRRIGAPAVELLLPSIHSSDAEVRRFVRTFVGRELRAGEPAMRRRILRLLVARGKGALGFVPELEGMVRRFDGELGFLAMVASMRIAGTRQHVRTLAEAPYAEEHLLSFDPERGRMLRTTAAHLGRQGGSGWGKALGEYLDLLAKASPGADRYLAKQVAHAQGGELMMWLDIADKVGTWTRPLGEAVAGRMRVESGRLLMALANTLLRGPKDWAPIAAPVREAVLARIGSEVEFTRAHLVLVLARCAGDDRRVLELLQEECKQPRASGVAALCALRARGVKGVEDPVEWLSRMDGNARRAALSRLILAGAPECVPVFLDRLRNGNPDEVRLVLAAADGMPGARLLLPGLRDVARRGVVSETSAALLAAGNIDRYLQWEGTEAMLLAGLRHDVGLVREKAVYACDSLATITPALVGGIEECVQDREVAKAMASFLPNSQRLGSRAAPLIPLLSRIVRSGAYGGLIWGGKSAIRWKRDCLNALTRIEPSHPAARDAFREGIASADQTMRVIAMLGFRRLERPEPEDYAAVEAAKDDKNEKIRAAAGRVLMSASWQEAYHQWKER